jgi:ribosomal protein S18 acetylase RimI-like enzyme
VSDHETIRQIDDYCDTQPLERARAEEYGPLVLFVPVKPGFPYYARPRQAGRGPVTAADVGAVRARQRELGFPESFEWIEDSAPEMAAAAAAAGLRVHRHPMLVLGTLVAPPPVPATTAVRILKPDDPELIQAWAVPGVAFNHPGSEIGRASVAERDKCAADHDPATIEVIRERLRSGRSVLATASGPNGPLGSGSYQYVGGVAEITGIGVLPAARRQGLGAAVTHALAAHALARDARTVFLSAADSDAARIYTRLGFREIGTAMIAEPDGAPLPDAAQRLLARGPGRVSLGGAADLRERRGGDARQRHGLAGQVRLVGITRVGGGGRQVRYQRARVEHPDEALEAENALEGLRAVTGGGVSAAAQLAFAQAKFDGDVLGAGGRVTEQGRGRADGRVRGAVGDQRPGHAQDPRGGVGRRQVRGQAPGGILAQVGQGNPTVAKLAQRQAEYLAARPGAEPDPDEDAARPHLDPDRPGIGAGHKGAGALLPDEVAARVGEHQAAAVGAVGNHAGPQARHGAAEGGGRPPLRVARSEPGARRHPVRR